MKIYPDPELPDVKVEWSECRPDTPDVHIRLEGIDNAASTTEVTVACADMKATVADVRRERFHVTGELLDAAGNMFVSADGGEVDLRNGFNKTTSLYFDAFANVRVTWTFSSGSCDSLGASDMGIFFSTPDEPEAYLISRACVIPPITGTAPAGIYTAQLRAFRPDLRVVAVSPTFGPFEVTDDGFVDLGTQTVTPCGAACP